MSSVFENPDVVKAAVTGAFGLAGTVIAGLLAMKKKAAESSSSPKAPASGFDQVAAVCYRKGPNGTEFLLVKTDGGRWVFPKGNVEPDERETPWRAAQREAFEESGATGRVHHETLVDFVHQKRGLKEKGIELRVRAFLLEVEKHDRPREKHRDPTWYSPGEAEGKLAADRAFKYADEYRRVVKAAVAQIG